jgi:hypothetical protein
MSGLSAPIYYDPGNSSSYPGTGTTLTNIGTLGNAAGTLGTMINVTYNSSSNGGIFVFNGSSSRINFNSFSFNTSGITITAWVKPVSQTSINTLMGNCGANTSTNGFKLGWNNWNTTDRRMWFEAGNGSSGYSISSTDAVVNFGEWQFLAYVFKQSSPTSLTFYKNGVLTPSTNSPTINIGMNQNWFIGTMNGAYFMNASLGEFKIFSSSLTSADISGEFENTKSRYGFSPPTVPTNFASSGITDSSHNLTWTAVSGATSYTIQRASDSLFNTILQTYSGITLNSQTITGLSSGTNYYYRILATNAAGSSSYSSGINVLTIASIPTGFSSSNITDSSHNLNWNISTGANSYTIQQSKFSNFSVILQTYSNILTNSRIITDLSSGTTYYYRIASVNSTGASNYSSGLSVKTIPDSPNTYYNNLTYESIKINWNLVIGAEYYNIILSTDNNFINVISDISINDISYNIINLDDNTQYYYKIRSINMTGGSYFSDIITFTTHVYSGITDISDNVEPNTDLTNFLLNNLENVFDTNQFKIYLRENKNNFNSQIGTVNVSDLSGILSSSYNVTGNENVKFIIFDDNETLEISGNNLNELKSGDILYLSGFDGDSINLLINGNNYNLTLNSTGIIYNSILYELGNNFRLGNDIEFIVKLLGSGGIEGNGIGDPFIKPIFGEKYYLPNDEETYLLFDNLDNLKIYCKNWFAPELNLNNKMSFMRYLIIEYNSLIFGIDLESMQYVKLTNNEDYKKMRLPRLRDEINKYCNFKSIDGLGKISNYYGKKYKMSRLNKKREIIFECDNYKIILKLICDTYYNDLRNNVNLIFSGQINENKIMKFKGAIISEKKIKKIDSSKLFFNKSLYY